LTKNIHKVLHPASFGRLVVISKKYICSLRLGLLRICRVEVIKIEGCVCWLIVGSVVVLSTDRAEITLANEIHQIYSSVSFNFLPTLSFKFFEDRTIKVVLFFAIVVVGVVFRNSF
jgi:hypothetical protein